MANYPDSVYSPRVMINRDNIVYDELRTKDIYAEDFNKDRDEIVAIETEFGTNIKGAFATLKARIEDLEQRVTALGG